MSKMPLYYFDLQLLDARRERTEVLRILLGTLLVFALTGVGWIGRVLA